MRVFLAKRKTQLKFSGQRRNNPQVRIVKYLTILLPFLSIIIGIKLTLPFFQIKGFYLEGYLGQETKAITTALEKKKIGNLLTLNTKDLEIELKKIDPGIQEISIQKIFPGTIKVIISHKEPIAEVIIDKKTVMELEQQFTLTSTASAETTQSAILVPQEYKLERFAIDNLGEKIEDRTSSNFPTTVIIGQSKEDILKEGSLTAVVDLIKNLQTIKFQSPEIYVLNEKTFVVKYEIETYILFTSEKDIKRQVRSLQEMLERFTIESIKPKRIDLRFEKAVVVF